MAGEAKVRRERALELERLAEALEGSGLCEDTQPLRDAAGLCRNRAPANDLWAYRVDSLLFRIGSAANSVPRDVYEVSLELSMSVVGPVSVWRKPPGDARLDDPFSALEVNIVVTAYSDPKRRQKLFSAWHLDRHLVTEGDGVPTYVHPLYHLHYGGKALWRAVDSGAYQCGDSLVLEAPRLVHPPMDAILATDFVATNYFPNSSEAYLKLKGDEQYLRLVGQAQERIWRPYSKALAEKWVAQAGTPSQWHCSYLWPSLCLAQG